MAASATRASKKQQSTKWKWDGKEQYNLKERATDSVELYQSGSDLIVWQLNVMYIINLYPSHVAFITVP
jgi:hypothetical protein